MKFCLLAVDQHSDTDMPYDVVIYLNLLYHTYGTRTLVHSMHILASGILHSIMLTLRALLYCNNTSLHRI